MDQRIQSKAHALEVVRARLDQIEASPEIGKLLVSICHVDENDLLQTIFTTYDFPTIMFPAMIEKFQEFTKVENVEKPQLNQVDQEQIKRKIESTVARMIHSAANGESKEEV